MAALAYPVGPTYRTGCKPGHAPLYFVGDAGACFRCGREQPPGERLTPAELVKLARRRHTPVGGLALLDEAITQTQLKLRALALLNEVDIEDVEAYGCWLIEREEERATVDQRLRDHDEADVRWALKAAYL